MVPETAAPTDQPAVFGDLQQGSRFLADHAPDRPDPILAARSAEAAGMLLEHGPAGLELRVPGERPGGGIRGEIHAALERRLEAGHPLRRIVAGLPDSSGPIIDATAGLGGDTAIAAASSNRMVVACERHPVVAALLEAGREQAVASGQEPAERIRIHHGDASGILGGGGMSPALVMLDPMFPPRRKSSALPPKPMQRLRALLGDGSLDVFREVESLLVAADVAGASRVVLKRPPDAPAPESPLGPPTFEISTKLLRWSVWERRSPTV